MTVTTMQLSDRITDYLITSLSVADIVREYFPDYKKEDNLLCPFHEDTNPSLRVFPNGGFKCFGCGKFTKDIVHTVALMEEITHQAAQRMLWDKIEKTVPENRITAFKRNLGNGALAYMLGRSLTQDTLINYEVGYDPYTKRVTIPIRNSFGICTNIRYVAIDRNDTKYKVINEKGHGNVFVFPINILLKNKTVLLVEGEIDALTGLQLGFPTISLTGGANGWDKRLLTLFAGKNVYILYDSDTAGQTAANLMQIRLMSVTNYVSVLPPLMKKGKDLNDWFRIDAMAAKRSLTTIFETAISETYTVETCSHCNGLGYIQKHELLRS